eukprot:g53492.t1
MRLYCCKLTLRTQSLCAATAALVTACACAARGLVERKESHMRAAVRPCLAAGLRRGRRALSSAAPTSAPAAASQAISQTSNVMASTTGQAMSRQARRSKSKLVGGLLASIGLGVGAAAYYDEGFYRTLRFWTLVGPIYAQYLFVQFRNETLKTLSDEDAAVEYERLHDRHAGRIEKRCYELRGFFMKQAQLMSTCDDFLPKQYLDWCKRTQDQAPTEMTPGQARAIIESELGRKIHDVFEWFDDEPHGVASIGEVHRAKLRPEYGGEAVVVKVMMPGIESRFRNDLNTTRNFCKLAMPHHVPAFNEIEKQYATEFNYVLEAQNLMLIHEQISISPFKHKVVVPKPHLDLCTKSVLTMEYLPGVKLVDGVRNQYRRLAFEQGTTLEAWEAERVEQVRLGLFQPKEAEADARRTRYLSYFLTFSDCVLSLNALRLCWNMSPLRVVLGRARYQWSEVPLNLGELLNLLLHVHAYEIFQMGAFNGDPHPGNILLMPDGRLGLIDYGQVKHFSLKDRVRYAKLTIALAEDKKDEVARLLFNDFGVKTKYMNHEMAYRLCAFWNDRDTPDITGGRNLQAFLDYIQEQDPIIDANDELVMCSRVSMMMRGMANAFGLKLRTAPIWKPYALQLLNSPEALESGLI